MNRVERVLKQPRLNPYQAITYLGGTKPDGGQWKCTQQECVEFVKKGYQFYVERAKGDKIRLVVARNAVGNEYIKTLADGDLPIVLLSLAELS
jgi:hypothetical protein